MGRNLIIQQINVEAAQVLLRYIKCVFGFASKHCNKHLILTQEKGSSTPNLTFPQVKYTH